MMTTLEGQKELVNYLVVQVMKFLDFKEKIHWFRQHSKRIYSSANGGVQPSDSISSAG